jgi:pimeloyl-ACP methyl ester carboxylesterase
MVCLPWFSLDRSVTAKALEPAVAACPNWQGIYVDLRGHGSSPPGPEHADGVVDVLAEFIAQEADSSRVLLASCSYGGYIAAALAAVYQTPSRTSSSYAAGFRIRKEDRDLQTTRASPNRTTGSACSD